MEIKPRVRYNQQSVEDVNDLMTNLRLNTVCHEATCPNLGECFQTGTATFMILGKNCSRNCRFCDVTHGNMEQVDELEPEHLAEAVKELGLKHVVVTSVARDDLADGGATQFANVIRAVKRISPGTTIEVLIPDFAGKEESIDIVLEANPDIINHNIETVRSLSPKVRHRATYNRSLEVLEYIKKKSPEIFTKTGIMLGLGEKEEEVYQAMDDCVQAQVDFFTIGQYLQPSDKHIELKEYVDRQTFGKYQREGTRRGFKFVASSAQVRSSYKAHEALVAGRKAQ